jgi:hypothetical protein
VTVPGPYDVVIRDKESTPPPPEVAHSWAPKKVAPGPAKTRAEASRDLIKSLASWFIVVALAIDGLALVFEPLELLRRGAPVSAAIASTLAAFGLASLFGLVAAVPIAILYSSVRLVGRMPGPWRHAWPIPLCITGWLIVANLAPHPVASAMTRTQARWLLLALLGGLLILATLVARIERTLYRSIAGAMLGGVMLGLTYALPPSIHHEPRDVVWFCLVVSALSVIYPLRRAMREASHARVMRGLGSIVAGSMALWALAPHISPSWRVYARDYGAFSDRMARLCRVLVDLDGDAFSAVLGGTDCDDLDMFRNPGMVERVGLDLNCNGIVRPAHPTPEQHGLAPEVGAPDAAEGEIDRVVVVTFDCFRNDAFSPAVTPNLTALASRGVTLTKLYAGGSRTALSLPLMWRGAYDREPVAGLLHAQGVTSSVIFAYNHGTLEGNVLDGFETVQRPPERDRRYRASEVTDLALADLRDPAHARKHLLWAHYFDAHGPRAARFIPPDLQHMAPIPGEGADSALYLEELAYDDRELGRLLEGVEQTGGLARTLVVVSADHGEGFGAHNMYEHGQSAFEEVVHVPGVVVAPGLPPGRYDHVVSHRDVVATVLGAFGLASKTPGAEEYGRSWLRLRGGGGAPLHSFVITYSASAHVFSWEEAPLMVRTDDDAKLAVGYLEGIERLYHLRSPARETRDVDPDYPAEAARDRRELEVYRDIDRRPP